GELSREFAAHVADVRDAPGALSRLKQRKMSVPAPIQPDHRKVEPFLAAHNPLRPFRRRSHGQPRRSHRQCIQKLTSCNHRLPSSLLAALAAPPPPDSIARKPHEIPAFPLTAVIPTGMLYAKATRWYRRSWNRISWTHRRSASGYRPRTFVPMS